MNIVPLLSGVKNQGLTLDGVDELVNLDEIVSGVVAYNEGAVKLYLEVLDNTPSTSAMFFTIADTNSPTYIYIGMNTSGELIGQANNNGRIQWQFKIEDTLPEGELMQIEVFQNTTTVNVKINGVPQTLTWQNTNDTSVWFDGLSGLDNARISSLNRNSFGEGFYSNIKIYSLIINDGSDDVNHFGFGNNHNDNYNSDVAKEWSFHDFNTGSKIQTVNCEVGDVE